MHFYIFDASKLNQRTYERVQHQLYSSVSEHKISGEIARITGARTIAQLVETAVSRQAKTLVAVGTDETLHEVINLTRDKDIVLGYIPVMETELSIIMGINGVQNAVRIISQRRVEELDLGMVNKSVFLTKANFGIHITDPSDKSLLRFFRFNSLKNLTNLPEIDIRFSADGKFAATTKAIGGVIVNTKIHGEGEKLIANPTDGLLDVFLIPKLSQMDLFKYRSQILSSSFEQIPNTSLVHVRKIEILSPENLAIKIGSKVLAHTPAIIEVVPKAVKIIVAKERNY